MKQSIADLEDKNFYSEIIALLESARDHVVRSVNQTMVITYFEIGKKIVEQEQGGNDRAVYGKQLLKGLSKELTRKIGKGFSVDNLENMRRFYLVYGKSETVSRISETSISETVSPKFNLSWSHYLKLLRIEEEVERKFYEIEAFKGNWSVRELQRQCDSALFARLVLSKNKDKVRELAEKGYVVEKPQDAIKDPYILEFIGLPENLTYTESDLEEELINKLEHFLLELGNGFTFVARQKRISFDEKHFRVDLVFYNRILQCFVLIDLKIGELKHQDLGQMQMYVNYFDRNIRLQHEQKTIGLIMCKDKSDALVEYTLPENNEQIFASKYKTVLPSKKELKLLMMNSKEDE